MARILNDIYHAGILEVVAACLSRKYNVQVTIGGGLATSQEAENGRFVITIPDLKYDDKLFTLVRAYVDHETAHVRFSDFGYLKDALRSFPVGERSGVQNAWNIVEDIYVEKLMGMAYPGCLVNLKEGTETIYADAADINSHPTGFRNSMEHGMALALYGARRDLYGSDLMRQAFNALAKHWTVIPDYVSWLEDDFLPRVPGASTKENFKLGCALFSKLKTLYNQYEPPKNDLSSAIQKAVSKVNRNGMLNRIAVGIAGDGSPGNLRIQDLKPNEIADADAVSAVLRMRLRSLLQAHVMQRRHVGFAGKLDTHLLHRVGVCNPRVFRTRAERLALNTDIIILVDSSGSMANAEGLVSGCTYAAVTALATLPSVRTSVYAFGAQTCIRVLGPGERPTKRMRINAAGGTPLTQSVKHVLGKFDYMSDRRRVLLVITDGAPDGRKEVARRVFRMAQERLDVDVVGIGIQYTGIYDLLPGSRIINNISEFPAALFSSLQEILLAA